MGAFCECRSCSFAVSDRECIVLSTSSNWKKPQPGLPHAGHLIPPWCLPSLGMTEGKDIDVPLILGISPSMTCLNWPWGTPS